MSHQFVENVRKQNEDHQEKMMMSIAELEQSIRTSKENHLTRFLDLTAKLRTTLEGNSHSDEFRTYVLCFLGLSNNRLL